ncbi:MULTISPECIES: guanylate kinase [unclassified Picosynechococcus]|uniref:guanylate kinase n=1 Tax=unclassified Picosynechococcus TaxID=3079910 RepID=UPI00074581B1|nr:MULTISPECIES: guanylate kinase [unclassified Picosynechococcus]AMA09514.1 guanylate kinase [Picosynechococcus sp. PCC 73109]ANV87679.1 guanylate kinase [Picosynechococcus sp. PCC 7117]
MTTPGKLIVLTGPSGVGKGTLVRSLLPRHQNLFLSISATTRQPRPGEVDGQDYFFKTREQFEAMIAAGELLEWAEYAGNYYGTPLPPMKTQIQQGNFVILEIEVIGANQVKDIYADALRIFILPPSFEELEQRLRGRGNDPEAAIAKRLVRAKEELAMSHEFDHEIVNDDLETALTELEKVIFS